MILRWHALRLQVLGPANHAFHSFGFGEILLLLSRKDEILSVHRLTTASVSYFMWTTLHCTGVSHDV